MDAPADFEAHATALILSAVPVMPKELARLMAQYARPRSGTRTIAGVANSMGHADGPALSAQFQHISCVAVDTTDPVAGPQLIIGETASRLRCLHLSNGTVSTIAGAFDLSGVTVDGPGSRARLSFPTSIAVAPNGVLFVADHTHFTIRRLSAAKWPAPHTPPAERMVTTLIGEAGRQVLFSSVKAFHCAMPSRPWGMALHCPATEAHSSRDVGRLYIGCGKVVVVADLSDGTLQRWPVPTEVSGLALNPDGSRLHALLTRSVHVFDTRTGASTAMAMPEGSNRLKAHRAMDCVFDPATASLVLTAEARLLRLGGLSG
jgi:hypothetical protein